MYRIKIPGVARRDIKSLSKKVQAELPRHLEAISLNPQVGEPLRGVLKGYLKYAFSFRATEYRIVYQVFPKEQLIVLIMVGSRENFYKRLRQRI